MDDRASWIIRIVDGDNVLEYEPTANSRAIEILEYNYDADVPWNLITHNFPRLERAVIRDLNHLEAAYLMRRQITTLREIQIILTATDDIPIVIRDIDFPFIVVQGDVPSGIRVRTLVGDEEPYLEGFRRPSITLQVDSMKVQSVKLYNVHLVPWGRRAKILLPRCTVLGVSTLFAPATFDYSIVEYLDLHISEKLGDDLLEINSPKLRWLRMAIKPDFISGHTYGDGPGEMTVRIGSPLETLDITVCYHKMNINIDSLGALMCDGDGSEMIFNTTPRKIINLGLAIKISFPYSDYIVHRFIAGTEVKSHERINHILQHSYAYLQGVSCYEHVHPKYSEDIHHHVYMTSIDAKPRPGWREEDGLAAKYNPEDVLDILTYEEARLIEMVDDAIDIFYGHLITSDCILQQDIDIPITREYDTTYAVVKALLKWIHYTAAYPSCSPIEYAPPMLAILKMIFISDHIHFKNMLSVAKAIGLRKFELFAEHLKTKSTLITLLN